jgi:error-prone DNA polymerase
MATFKFTGGVSKFRDKLINGMIDNGYERRVRRTDVQATRRVRLSYGFPESHAASFALIAYASAWLKCWHPDVFCAALLNSQPMGFYAPAQIVRDARDHGVEIRPVCANASRWDCTLEPTDDETRFAVRLGLRMVKGLSNAHAAAIVGARGDSPSLRWTTSGAAQASRSRPSTQIAEADASGRPSACAARGALGDQGAAGRAVAALRSGLCARGMRSCRRSDEPAVALRPMTAGGESWRTIGHVGLSLRTHPVAFLREDLQRRRIVTCQEAMDARDRRWLEIAGDRAGPPAAGQRQGRHVHHAGGRERGRQSRRLAERVREEPPHHPLGGHDRGARPRPARGRGGSSCRSAPLRICRPNSRAWASETVHSRCRMAAATKFHHGSTPDPRGLAPKGLRTARHLHPGSAPRHDQGEDAGFPVGKAPWG